MVRVVRGPGIPETKGAARTGVWARGVRRVAPRLVAVQQIRALACADAPPAASRGSALTSPVSSAGSFFARSPRACPELPRPSGQLVAPLLACWYLCDRVLRNEEGAEGSAGIRMD